MSLKMDMDLIEVLWKQDVDLGFTLVEPTSNAPAKKTATSKNPEETEEEAEKLKALEAINSTNVKQEEIESKDSEKPEEDPWAGLPYTIDLETGEYILSGSSKSSEDSEEQQLLAEASLGLDQHALAELTEDSLGFDEPLSSLENDFTSELLSDELLGASGVDGLLCNDSLGLPDGFNLEEALQLVGLDEDHPQEDKQLKRKQQKEDSSLSERDEARKSREDLDGDEMHTSQMHHHSYHPHYRSFQSRVPPLMRTHSMEQRWQDVTQLIGLPDHHFVHPGYPGHGVNHSHYAESQRNVLLHNATLAPPVGDLNNTENYHSNGGPSNLGSAVATSMNLTNHETMGAENGAVYKSEPNEMMYYHPIGSESMNQTGDGFFNSSFLDDAFVDMAMSDNMYSMRMLENSNANGNNNNNNNNNNHSAMGATALPGVNATGVAGLPGDERMDASSDSAVSSMGSERVPSLSDGEWMETGSNSSQTQADSHYSMDYHGKYHRMPYDYNCTLPGRHGASPRLQSDRNVPPVAQKKHQMFAKRYFQEQGTGSPLGATAHTTMKYDYDAQTVAAGAPGNAYSGPIEGAVGPQPEVKYSCSVDFTRHQSGRSAVEHVHHNHTYHLPPESSGSLQRPLSRDKKSRKSEADEHLSRDEKRARSLSVPISVSDIINLPMDEFNERLSKHDLTEAQLSLIRDIRRRGKNKVAAQNCRKRKMDQITSLADQVKKMKDRKTRLIQDRDFMLHEKQRVKQRFSQLYQHVFNFLRDPQGNLYSPHEYMLHQTADGNVCVMPRNHTNPHQSRTSSYDSKAKREQERKE